MSEHSPYSNQFTEDDIKRYVQGEMTPPEMHRMESAALQDPFLADAIEGMRLFLNVHGKEAFVKDVNELKSRLKRKKVETFAWWKAAAVLFVLVTTVAVAFFIVGDNRKQPVILSEARQLKNDAKDTQPHASQSTITQDTAAPAKNEVAVQKPKRQQRAPDPAIAPDTAAPAKTEVAVQQPERMEAPVEISGDAAAREKPSQPARTKEKREETAVSGFESDKAVASAQKAEVAREKEPDSMMEVVVVQAPAANENAKFRKMSKGATVEPNKRIVPVGGWRSFDEYLNSNRKINPGDTLLHGVQEISFAIDDRGEPYDLRIEKSLSPEVDSETVRLIAEGPTWKVAGNKRKLKLKIIF